MNCKKVRRLLPLLVGSELSPSRKSALESHLQGCPKCQSEYHAYVLSMKKTQEWLAAERKDWEDSEWKRAVRKAVEEEKEPEGVSPFTPWPFKKVWAFALMALLAAGLTLVVLKPGLIKEKGRGTRMLEESQQEIVTMTFVSQETGLKITWLFNKNFAIKEEK